jgi:hypothetical protein
MACARWPSTHLHSARPRRAPSPDQLVVLLVYENLPNLLRHGKFAEGFTLANPLAVEFLEGVAEFSARHRCSLLWKRLDRRNMSRVMVLRIRTDGFVDPCIPSRAPKPPTGPSWAHEIKHDRYRLIVRPESEAVPIPACASF